MSKFNPNQMPQLPKVKFNLSMPKGGPLIAGALGAAAFLSFLPTAYRWDMIPFVGSPAYYEKAKTIKYDMTESGFVYSPYDDGNPLTEMPETSKDKTYLGAHPPPGYKWQWN